MHLDLYLKSHEHNSLARNLAWQSDNAATTLHMLIRYASLIFAVAGLAGAVIYAQQKAQKSPRVNPVFDTSKSGTPTPIDATDEEKDAIKKQNEYRKNKTVEQTTPKEKWPEPAEPGKKERKKVMPSSKSYIPDSPE